jgi:hypothetical protein
MRWLVIKNERSLSSASPSTPRIVGKDTRLNERPQLSYFGRRIARGVERFFRSAGPNLLASF